MVQKEDKIYVAGHGGMVGAAIFRILEKNNFTNIVTRTHSELDLSNQQAVDNFFAKERPDYVFLAAAKVGGIVANSTYPADFLYENIAISTNIIYFAWKYQVKKLLNLGSSCIYPKFAKQPIKEESLLSDVLEPTNEAYAIAKITAIKLCHYYNQQYHTNFISAMPSNLYGIGDNYHLENSHVLPAMVRKFYDATQQGADLVTLWGDGSPLREFLYVDDLADAALFLIQNVDKQDISQHINIGYGSDIAIKELADIVKSIVGYKGAIVWDRTKPNGTPRKLMDSSKINALGWKAQTLLKQGIETSYAWFKAHYAQARK